MNSKDIWHTKIEDFKNQLKTKGKGNEVSINILWVQILAIVNILRAKHLISEEEFYTACNTQLDGISTKLYNQSILSAFQEGHSGGKE